MHKTKVLSTIVLIFSIASVSNALNVVYVDVNSPNDPGTGSFVDPFRKIQDAIDYANDGDTIEIRPGIYTGDPNNYNLDPNGKSITIRSVDPNDPEVIANTIIDPNGAGRGFYFQSGEDANCVVSGLTIRNGYSEPGFDGGNIYCFNSKPTIRNCVLQGGHARGSGGGLYCDSSDSAIVNCTIVGNSAEYYGGGIACAFCDPVIVGCTMRSNSAFEGGGIDIGASSPTVVNSVIYDNKAFNGGGINCYYPSEANVSNCTIVANSATNFGGALYCQYDGGAQVENSIFWANDANTGDQLALTDEGHASVAYCDVQGQLTEVYDPCGKLNWGTGNIDADPCFALFDANDDPNLWDFHLQSAYGRWDENFHRVDFNKDRTINLFDFAELANEWLKEGSNLPEDLNHNGKVDWADLQILTTYFLATGYRDRWVFDALTSLCVDTGDPNSEWAGEPWPNGKHINMGAYGGTNQASMNGNPADFNIDGVVNFVDFAEFSSQWKHKKLSADIATEVSANLVNFLDWAVFAAAWQSVPSLSNWNVRCDIFPENGDGIVDIDDLAVFVDQWLQFGVYSADIAPSEGDSIVDMLDFAVFAQNWLWQQE